MQSPAKAENAVAAIRVSSVKQGVEGDSPEAQKEQIENFTKAHNITVKKYFVFLESASKEEQPVQEAIDYCKNPKNDISIFIIKSIDRFTRGGSFFYEYLKRQLEKSKVKLIDIYGIIGNQQVNTLEHLGVSFNWSVYSPTKKAEMLEAERAKDEMRDILSRMIGAEIRYARLGYWVRRPPIGYKNIKIETPHGKRTILKPHPVQSVWIKKMFELRARGNMTDDQIIKQVNKLGFKSGVMYRRDKKDRTKIIGKTGNNKLKIKAFWKYIRNPIYAGINYINWTKENPQKGKFEGLVSIDIFNKANKGKVTITEEDGKIKVYKKKPPDHLLNKGVRNPEYPYKRIVLCPECKKPLYGSASRGRLGKYYPAYHCNKRGHYFRVPKDEFERTIKKFVNGIELAPGYSDALTKAVINEWEKRQHESDKDLVNIDRQIDQLKTQASLTADKIRMLTSEVGIKYMEEELIKLDQQMAELLEEKQNTTPKKEVDIKMLTAYIKYFLEHLEDLLLYGENPELKAKYFGVLFDKIPTYQDLVSGTHEYAQFIALNEVFTRSESHLVTPRGIEPRLPG